MFRVRYAPRSNVPSASLNEKRKLSPRINYPPGDSLRFSVLLPFLLLEVLFNCPNEFAHQGAAMCLRLRPQALDQSYWQDKSDFLRRVFFILHARIIHGFSVFVKPMPCTKTKSYPR